ncbi:MAG: hypothetical protein U0930_07430 [Pirellulales bacterium]
MAEGKCLVSSGDLAEQAIAEKQKEVVCLLAFLDVRSKSMGSSIGRYLVSNRKLTPQKAQTAKRKFELVKFARPNGFRYKGNINATTGASWFRQLAGSRLMSRGRFSRIKPAYSLAIGLIFWLVGWRKSIRLIVIMLRKWHNGRVPEASTAQEIAYFLPGDTQSNLQVSFGTL